MTPVFAPCLLARLLLWALPVRYQWKQTDTEAALLAHRVIKRVLAAEVVLGLVVNLLIYFAIRGVIAALPPNQVGWGILGVIILGALMHAGHAWACGFTPPNTTNEKINTCMGGELTNAMWRKSRRLSVDLLEAWMGQESTALASERLLQKTTIGSPLNVVHRRRL